jgi:hypothetical protein
MAVTLGDVTEEIAVGPITTGSELTSEISSVTIDLNTLVNVTGSALAPAVGEVDAVSVAEVTGSSLTSLTGSVIISATANVNVTGSSLIISTSGAKVIAWAEVNTGTSVIWTDVDIAA